MTRRSTTGWALLAVLIVTGATAVAEPTGKPMRKQDWKPPIFVGGPRIDAKAELDAWITAQRMKQRSIKLPFTILGDKQAVLGVVDGEVPAAQRIRLDDGALGVSLAERLRQLCPDRAQRCALWLSGRFGTLQNKDEDPRKTFSIFIVHERVADNVDRATLRAEGERPVDCLAIRFERPLHCARGASRCEKCRDAQKQPARPKLLDLCPEGDHARPTITVVRDGKEQVRVYDFLRAFDTSEAAEEFAQKHGITDVVAR